LKASKVRPGDFPEYINGISSLVGAVQTTMTPRLLSVDKLINPFLLLVFLNPVRLHNPKALRVRATKKRQLDLAA
jgi:hypothetical protein